VPDGEYTAVQFGAMSTAEADFASVSQAVNSTLQSLDSELNSSLTLWTGSAQQAYHVLKAKWDAAAYDMATVVGTLGQVVGVANQNYTQAESVNTSMWE